MKTINLQKEWRRIIKEIHDKPRHKTPYPKKVVRVRDLLLFAEVLLGKIGNKEDVLLNSELYEKIMVEYYRRKLSLRIN